MLRSIALLLVTQLMYIGYAQTWQQLPSFPGTPRDDAASFMIGDHIYVGTGMEVGWGLTNDWWRFNVISETWDPIASLPASPRQYCTTFTILDTGFVFGGLDNDGALNELWAYYPAQDQWIQRASLPAEARYASVGHEVVGSGVIATGMLGSGVPTNETWRYWPETDSWEQLNDMPGPARHRAAATIEFGSILICGGADGNFAALDDCWSSPVWQGVGQWSEAATMPAPRYGHRGAGYGVVIGGASDTFELHDDVWNLGTFGPPQLPVFAGGPRRGGIGIGRSANGYIIHSIYFGLGIGPVNDDFIRFNDWWKWSFPVGISDQDVAQFNVFPNPTTDHITLQLSDQWNNGTVSIHDALGRTMKQLTIPADRTIDLNDLATGRYEIFVRSTDQRTLRAPLIKLE